MTRHRRADTRTSRHPRGASSSRARALLDFDRLETRRVPAPIPIGGILPGNTVLNNAAGYEVTADLTIPAGVTLTLAGGISLQVDAGKNIIDRGNFVLQANSTLSLQQTFQSTTQVEDFGTMTATSANVVNLNGPNSSVTTVVAEAGGTLTATGTTFSIDTLSLLDGSIITGTNQAPLLTNDTFNTEFSLPIVDVPFLANNKSFQDLGIITGSVPAGQSITLPLMGSNTAMTYSLTGNLTIPSGASLALGTNATLIMAPNVTLTDAGAMTAASGSTVGMSQTFQTTTKIAVSGSLTATSANFGNTRGANSSVTTIAVASGGHLAATGSVFSIDSMSWADGSILNGGDLTGNGFDLPITVPYGDVAVLSGNRRFQTVNIVPGDTVQAGQTLALTPIGSDTNVNLVYAFSGTFTVGVGATLGVAPGISVLLTPGALLEDDGSMTVASGATVSMQQSFQTTTRIDVVGTLASTSASFVNSNGANSSVTTIAVASGGHLAATGSVFSIDSMTWADGSVLNPGDLTTDGFDLPITVPFGEVAALAGNRRFQTVNILPGGLGNGQSLALNKIGSDTTANLVYAFSGTFTVGVGATLGVAPGVSVLLTSGTTLAVGGATTFSAGDTVSFQQSFQSTTRIVDTGSLSATSASFVNFNGSNSSVTAIQVNSGARFTADGDVVSVAKLTLASGTVDTLGFNVLTTQFTLDSGATLNVAQNNLSNASTTVVATGATGTQINLAHNYWGTNNAALIQAKITDQHTNSSLPQVLFSPVVGAPATNGASSVVTTYSFAAHSVTLTATVTAGLGTVNEGTETFTILGPDGATPIGTPPGAVNVVNGSASVSYPLPAGLAAGTYTIQASYSGTDNFLGNVDSTHALTVNQAPTVTAAGPIQVTFSPAPRTINLGATATVAGGVINEGTVTFTVKTATGVLGSVVAANVSGGTASVPFTIPGGTAGGTYTIQATYADAGGNFASSSDLAHALTIAPASTTTAAVPVAPIAYSVGVQTVAVSANVTSPAGTVGEGIVTFSILANGAAIATSTPFGVSGGSAATTLTLPAGLAAGTYTVQATYSGSSSFVTSADATQSLTITAAATTTTASPASTGFAVADRTVTLRATVTSPAGTVNEGQVTFTVLANGSPVGAPKAANVVNGAASVAYTIPGGTAPGAFTIQAVYTDPSNFTTSSDGSQALTITAASTTTQAGSPTAFFSENAQSVALTAAVASGAGTVDGGSVTFTVMNGSTPIGQANGPVSGGSASAVFTLPAGTAPGSYKIVASYGGTADFGASSDASHSLGVTAASTAVHASAVTAPFAVAAQGVTLSATVTSPTGPVDEGTVTFTVLRNGVAIGPPVPPASVAAGQASADFTIPAGTGSGTYTIRAVYTDPADFSTSSDASQSLTITAASTTLVVAPPASVPFSNAIQSIPLSATASSPAGTVNGGTVSFTILRNGAALAPAVMANVVAGGASASYPLPAGAHGGSYTVEATYTGGADFLGSTDASQSLLVVPAASTTRATGASAVFSTSAGPVKLTATVTSAAGVVGSGTVTFTVLDGAATVGVAVPATVSSAGVATATYTIPAGAPAKTYTVLASFGGTTDFAASTDSTQALKITPALSTTVATSTTASFSESQLTVPLVAKVTSPAGPVNEGAVTFTLFRGATAVGQATPANVSGGTATASYVLPAGTAPGVFTIRAVFAGAGDIVGSSDAVHALSLGLASTTVTASAASVAYSASARVIPLTATVTSPAGPIGGGTVVFSVLSGTKLVGQAASATVAAGKATANYTLPATTAPGTYTIRAEYESTADLRAGTDAAHALTVTKDATSVNVGPSSFGPLYRGESLAINAIVSVVAPGSGKPTGAVAFNYGGKTVAIEPVVSAAGLTYAQYPKVPYGVGTYTFQAVYSGDADDAVSLGSVTFTVGPDPTATALTARNSAGAAIATATKGQAVTLTAAVGVVAPGSGTAAGSVTFRSGSTVLGTVKLTTVKGVPTATLTTTALPVGTDAITAVYGGDGGDLTSTSAPVVVKVTGPAPAKPALLAAAPSGPAPAQSQAIALAARPAAAPSAPTVVASIGPEAQRRAWLAALEALADGETVL